MVASLWLGSLARLCTPSTDGDGKRQAESGLRLYANVVASMSSGAAQTHATCNSRSDEQVFLPEILDLDPPC